MINVIKRDGSKVPLDLNKIHNVLEWACEGFNNVSVSDIEIASKLQLYDGIKTDSIHTTLIKAAADLITTETPNYQYVAARLLTIQLRKRVLKQYIPIPVFDLVKRNVELGLYDPRLLTWYTQEEFNRMDEFVDHSRDENFSYVGLKQAEGKYLVQTRHSKRVYETPQYMFLLIAASFCQDDPKDVRLDNIKDLYNAFSTFDITLPTPIMAGLRTPQYQYSSCTVIDVDDTLPSISAASAAIVKYVAQKAGIGLNGGRIRAEGSKIRDGHAVHTGVTPFYRLFESSVKSCSQGGVRNGSATLHVVAWHLEIMDILPLKNNQGTSDNRVRSIDYSLQLNGYMYQRLINNQNITLFSPHEVPDLYQAYFMDQVLFAELYEKYERSHKVRKSVVTASELFALFISERAQTGRWYLMNVDHCNTHSAFDETKAPIYLSNLCQEITLPTKPLSDINDGATMRMIAVDGEDYEAFRVYDAQHPSYLPYNWGNKFEESN